MNLVPLTVKLRSYIFGKITWIELNCLIQPDCVADIFADALLKFSMRMGPNLKELIESGNNLISVVIY